VRSSGTGKSKVVMQKKSKRINNQPVAVPRNGSSIGHSEHQSRWQYEKKTSKNDNQVAACGSAGKFVTTGKSISYSLFLTN